MCWIDESVVGLKSNICMFFSWLYLHLALLPLESILREFTLMTGLLEIACRVLWLAYVLALLLHSSARLALE